jgi:hypothetical protein
MALLLGAFAPAYVRNYRLQTYVSELTQRAENRTRSDDVVRTLVLDESHRLNLPVTADNVQVIRAADGAVKKVEVRYKVQVNLPGYTVNLHFYPGAGSR